MSTGVTNVKVGDRVAVEPILYCGHCEFCLRGDYNLCKYTNAGFMD
ncbi:alcohol dehydrogenase catalytic domain-containing protein [Caldifermentibacillus hisashii]